MAEKAGLGMLRSSYLNVMAKNPQCAGVVKGLLSDDSKGFLRFWGMKECRHAHCFGQDAVQQNSKPPEDIQVYRYK